MKSLIMWKAFIDLSTVYTCVSNFIFTKRVVVHWHQFEKKQTTKTIKVMLTHYESVISAKFSTRRSSYH